MGRYNKAIAAVVGAVLSAIIASLTDNRIGADEWINVAIAGVTAATVFTAPNVPGSRYTKGILAVLMAILTGLVSSISDGWSTAELLQIAIAVLTALGVYGVKNDPAPGLEL